MCDPDNAAYFACFLDAAISAAAPADDADADIIVVIIIIKK